MTASFLSTLTGSFSRPAGENPTVVMMEAAYAHHGVDARYLNCEVAAEGLGDAVRGAVAMGWAGFNCSIPHKIAVIEHLDALAESARLIGAVNCVVREGDRLVGHNTDGQGFVASLREVRDVPGARVVVLGAGGAARAIAVELALAGAASVTVAARRAAPGQELARLVGRAGACAGEAVPWDGELTVPAGTDVLVNATDVGLAPDVDAMPAVDVATLAGVDVVADVVPNPPRTRLLRAAEAAGCRTLDGLGMLVEQGAAAVRLWTGVDPDRTVMRQRLAQVLQVQP